MSDISGISGYNSNRIRMTGLATGQDTDDMVKKMMAAENMRVDKMKQNRQYVLWQQEGYRDIMKDLSDLRQNYFLIDSPDDTNLVKTSTYSGSIISSSIVSGSSTIDASDYVTATALPGAVNGTSSITVNRLAKSAKLVGSGINLSGEINNLNNFQGASIEFNGKAITLDSSFTSTDGLVKNINEKISANLDLKGKISAVKETIDGKDYVRFCQMNSESMKITAAKKSDKSDLTELGGIANKELNANVGTKLSDLGVSADLTFTIKQGTKESSTITVDKDKTIQEFINAIYNAESKAGDTNSTLYSDLQVNYSDLTKSLTIQTRNTGSAQSLEINADSSTQTIFESLGLKVNSSVTGQDAEVSITPAGATTPTTVTKSSNNFTIDNVTYNLIKDPNGAPYTATLTAKPDSKKSFDKIKTFVDKYNTIVKKISDKIQEKKEYSYKPLTDVQKKDMKEDEIKAWEEKAKKGIFKNDGDLQNILNNLRRAFSDGVKSAGITLKEIGIDTYGSFEAISKPGQLKIDETKLKAALENRGDQVMNLFKGSPDSSIKDDKEIYNNTGILKRIESIIYKSTISSDGNLVKKVGYVGSSKEFDNDLTKRIKSQDKSIEEMQKKLAAKENNYYSMFARLEKAMNQLNSQQNWLMQQMAK